MWSGRSRYNRTRFLRWLFKATCTEACFVEMDAAAVQVKALLPQPAAIKA